MVGKPIGGGVPLAAYGMTEEIADRLTGPMLEHEADVSGVGGTLTANALALAAARAALSSALREEDYAVAIPLAERFTEGVQGSSSGTGCPGTSSSSAAARSTGSARRPATVPPRPPPSTTTSSS